jgi:hypothetical protein
MSDTGAILFFVTGAVDLLYNEERAALHLIVDSADVFAQDSESPTLAISEG